MALAGDIPVYFTKSQDGKKSVEKGTVGPMMLHLKELLGKNKAITVP